MSRIALGWPLVRLPLADSITWRNISVASGVGCLLAAAALPSPDAGYSTVLIGGRRPIYTPEFTGLAMATIVFAVLAPALFGWLRIANRIAKQPLEIVSCSPVSKYLFCESRWIADVILLCLLLLVVGIAGCVLVWQHGEAGYAPPVWNVFPPLLFCAIPTIALIAGVRSLLEAHPITRGAIAECLLLVVWLTAMTATAIAANSLDDNALLDPFGIAGPLRALASGTSPVSFGIDSTRNVLPLRSQGLLKEVFTPTYLYGRLFWTAVGAAMPLIAASWFKAGSDNRSKRMALAAANELAFQKNSVRRSGKSHPGGFALPPLSSNSLPKVSRGG